MPSFTIPAQWRAYKAATREDTGPRWVWPRWYAGKWGCPAMLRVGPWLIVFGRRA
jgi:hypothetical protein